MRLPFAFAAMLSLLPTLGVAAMPRFDVEAHCNEIASFGGAFSESLNSACFEQEQDAYDGLKSDWDRLPTDMKQHCQEIAEFGGGGSYSLLQACIQQEAEAAAKPKTFSY